MFNELINMHKQITELMSFESAFYIAVTWGIVKLLLRVSGDNEVILSKDIKRILLVVVREFSIFITSIMVATIFFLGFYSEEMATINVVKFFIIWIVLIIIKRVANSIIIKGDLKDGNV